MSQDRPRFDLRRLGVIAEADVAPEIYRIGLAPSDAISRRSALAAGVGLSGAALAAAIAPRAAFAQKATSELLAHHGLVTALRFSKSGTYLISSALDNKAKLWDVGGRQLKTSYDEQTQAPLDVAFVTEALQIVTVDADGTLKGYAFDTSSAVRDHAMGNGGLWWSFAARADAIAAVHDHSLRVFVTKPGAETEVGSADIGGGLAPPGLLFSPDGKIVIAFYADQTMQTWLVAQTLISQGSARIALQGDMALAREATDDRLKRLGAVISSDGTRLAVSGPGRIQIYDLPALQLLSSIPFASQRREAMAFRDEALLAVASSAPRPRIQLWSRRESAPLGTTTVAIPEVSRLEFGPKGDILASGHTDGSLILWTVPSLRLIARLYERAINLEEVKTHSFDVRDAITGVMTRNTLPCGSTMPPGSVCTCNCIGGTLAPPPPPPILSRHNDDDDDLPSFGSQSGSQPCGAPIPRGAVCTCNCVPVCQAHRLLDGDATVRRMAEAVLLAIGRAGVDYMRWAALPTGTELSADIHRMIGDVERGRSFSAKLLPPTSSVMGYLDGDDEIAAIMAAQCLRLREWSTGECPPPASSRRVRWLLDRSVELDWRHRR